MLTGPIIVITLSIMFLAPAAMTIYYLIKLFQSLGIEPAWSSIVPVWSQYNFLQAGGQNGNMVFFVFLPFVGPIIVLVYMVMAADNIGKSFGKSSSWMFLYIFLGWLWIILLGIQASKELREASGSHQDKVAQHTAELVAQVQQEMSNANNPAPRPYKFQPYEMTQQKMNSTETPPQIILESRPSLDQQVPQSSDDGLNTPSGDLPRQH